MIDSTSPSDRAARSSAALTDLPKPATPRIQTGRDTDTLSTDQNAQLQNALQQVPEIRADVVARGQALAADPSYPPLAVIGQVAAAIVNSPDLSEDEG